MATDPLIQQGNQAAANLADVQSRSGIAAGNAGSPWSLPPLQTSAPLNAPTVMPMTPGKAIPVDQITPQVPLNLPQPQPTMDNGLGMVAGAKVNVTAAQKYLAEQQALQTPEQKLSDTISSRLNELIPQQAGQAQTLADEQAKANVPQLQKDIRDLGNQILTRSAEYDKLLVDTENASNLKGSFSAKASQIVRTKAAEIGMLNSRVLALQGNLFDAKETAAKATDLKYAPIFEELTIRQQQLAVLQPLLDKQEKNQATALQRQYDEQKQALQDAKEKETLINNVMLHAATTGADNETLSRIQASGSLGEAIKNSGNFLSAEFRQKVQQQQFDNNIKLQELNISRAKVAIEQRKQAMDEAAAQGLGNAAEITAYAQQYAATGAIPTGMPKGTFGLVSEIAKELPKANGTIVNVNTGIKPAGDDTKFGAYANVYSVLQLAGQLKELDAKRPRGITGGLMSWANESDSKRYIQLKDQIVDLLSRARSGAALTVTEERKYNGMLPARFADPFGIGGNTQNTIDNFIKNVGDDLNSKLATEGWAIYGVSTVKINGDPSGKTYKVGEIISNGQQSARVNPDGSLTGVE